MTAVCAICWCATEDALGHSKNSSSNWLILSKSSYFLLVNSCFSLLLLLLKSVNILLYCGEREFKVLSQNNILWLLCAVCYALLVNVPASDRSWRKNFVLPLSFLKMLCCCWRSVTRYGSKHYWTVAGSFLFVSALIIYHGSRQVLLEFQSEHQQHQLVSVYADPLVECLCDDAKLINPSSNVLQIHRSSCSQEADRRGYNLSWVIHYSAIPMKMTKSWDVISLPSKPKLPAFVVTTPAG